jgi:hypothetical protein
MLGEKLGESTDQLTMLRMLPDGMYEGAFRGNDTFLDREITDNGTYVAGNLDSGAVCLEGHVMLNNNDDSGLTVFKGFGLGNHIGRFPDSNHAVMGEFLEANGTFQRLANVACVMNTK